MEARSKGECRISARQRTRINRCCVERWSGQIRVCAAVSVEGLDRQVAEARAATIRERPSGILTDAVLDRKCALTNECTRESAADNTLAFVSKHPVQEAWRALWAPDHAYAGCKVIEV